MIIEFLLLNFELFVFFSISFIVVSFFLLFFIQNNKFDQNKDSIINYANQINKSNNELKDYLNGIGNILEIQNKEITKIVDKIAFIEREMNRLLSIKGSEDMLGIAIDMAQKGEDRETIKNKTSLRDDEIEAIYTYYRK